MTVCWIKITDGLTNGIQLINQIEHQKFRKLLSHMMNNASERSEGGTFTPEELVALEKVLKLDTNEVSLVLKTIKHIVKRMSKFVMRPANLTLDFTEALQLEEEKSKLFVNLYKTVIQNTSEEFNITNFGDIDRLIDLSWQLNIELSSSLNKKERSPTVSIDMKTKEPSKAENKIMELNYTELQSFYQQIEVLQSEIDNIVNTQQ